MNRSPILVVAGCAVLIVGGLALATVMPLPGTVVAVGGIVLLGLYLVAVFLLAWRGDQWRAWVPGSLYREHRDEQAAKRGQDTAGEESAARVPSRRTPPGRDAT